MGGNYKRLIVWQKADELAKKIYVATQCFPKSELFGITSQIRRAALSVPTNIVEGYSRRTKNELRRFLNIALGSLAETEYLVDFSYSLELWAGPTYQEISSLRLEVGSLLWKFIQSID